jgi:hypothetical protein
MTCRPPRVGHVGPRSWCWALVSTFASWTALALLPLGAFARAPVGDPAVVVMDRLPGYSRDHLFQVLTDLGPDGRAQYAVCHLVDCASIASYLLLGLAVARLLRLPGSSPLVVRRRGRPGCA